MKTTKQMLILLLVVCALAGVVSTLGFAASGEEFIDTGQEESAETDTEESELQTLETSKAVITMESGIATDNAEQPAAETETEDDTYSAKNYVNYYLMLGDSEYLPLAEAIPYVYTEADHDNYEQLVFSAMDWNKLSAETQAEVDAVLTEADGMTYLELLQEAVFYTLDAEGGVVGAACYAVRYDEDMNILEASGKADGIAVAAIIRDAGLSEVITTERPMLLTGRVTQFSRQIKRRILHGMKKCVVLNSRACYNVEEFWHTKSVRASIEKTTLTGKMGERKMSAIITSQVAEAKNQIHIITGKSVTDDRAFCHMLLRYIFGYDFIDQLDLVTDGANDGGIDFLAFDEEDSKVIVCQSKYTSSLSFEQIITELSKMYSTVQNFKSAHTGSYNDRLKKALQNVLDRLPDENIDNIEYNIFTTAPLDVNKIMRKTSNIQHEFPADAVTIYTADQIEKEIQKAQTQLPTVKYAKIKLDQAKNYLRYESDDLTGIQCNVLSTSIIQLYNKYAGGGLFDLNIRKYIKNKLVDSAITRTLDSDRENFWFLNNGIIIACTDFDVDGDTVSLTDFSIVNGGQTTTLLGTYKGTNAKEFYVPCKIVATKDRNRAAHFYTKIAEATNSQKPIYPRDLKSNAPEMLRLQKWLEQDGIYLEIKRGNKARGTYKYSIKNDEFGQILLSFAHQQPGTSRSGKKKIFDTPAIYDKIFKVNYDKESEKKGFVKDLIKLNSRYTEIEKEYKISGLTPEETEILKNGKYTIFALMGVCYRLSNNDISEEEILNTPKSIANIPFEYGAVLSNYHDDDLDEKLKRIVKYIVAILADSYKNAFNNGQTTSVSNYMKTDQRYYNDIAPKFVQAVQMLLIGKELKTCIDIFKR